MEKVTVNTSKTYDIIIGENIISDIGFAVKNISKAEKIAIITDNIVEELYLDIVKTSLENEGFNCVSFSFENGEKSKNIQTFSKILEFLADNALSRKDLIIALGGGVVGDISGFAASTYMRGIDYIQIPTTLLAAVDSSVGGKTAIDLKAGKNLAGTFYQPSLVFCDCAIIKTLPEEIFSDGMAEVIKYGAAFDNDFFLFLDKENAKDNMEYIIKRCVEIKRDVVEADEKENGIRAILNFGHTFAHSIEKLSNYRISHGKAVAIGMVLIANGAYKCGFSNRNISEDISSLNNKYNLPSWTDFSAEVLAKTALLDKKRSANTITLAIPEKLGKAILIEKSTDILKEIAEKGLLK